MVILLLVVGSFLGLMESKECSMRGELCNYSSGCSYGCHNGACWSGCTRLAKKDMSCGLSDTKWCYVAEYTGKNNYKGIAIFADKKCSKNSDCNSMDKSAHCNNKGCFWSWLG